MPGTNKKPPSQYKFDNIDKLTELERRLTEAKLSVKIVVHDGEHAETFFTDFYRQVKAAFDDSGYILPQSDNRAVLTVSDLPYICSPGTCYT